MFSKEEIEKIKSKRLEWEEHSLSKFTKRSMFMDQKILKV